MQRLANDIHQTRAIVSERLPETAFQRSRIVHSPAFDANRRRNLGMIGAIEIDGKITFAETVMLAGLDPAKDLIGHDNKSYRQRETNNGFGAVWLIAARTYHLRFRWIENNISDYDAGHHNRCAGSSSNSILLGYICKSLVCGKKNSLKRNLQAISLEERETYLQPAALRSCAAGRNFKTFEALILIGSPVCGLRPLRAARLLIENVPKVPMV